MYWTNNSKGSGLGGEKRRVPGAMQINVP